jgi:rare lipoprotein A
MPVSFARADDAPITRRDGFLLMWNTIKRPAEPQTKARYDDILPDDPGFTEITYAKRRNILPDEPQFRPDDPLLVGDALLWLFRTRNIENVDPDTGDGMGDILDPEDVPAVLARYAITNDTMDATLTRDALTSMIQDLDAKLRTEDHEVSLYSEKFQGKGTAFGESFDMNQMTAAHRSFPYNTLVKVTNTANGKSVVVRVNDRGPWVPGRDRDMDMSLASFLQISSRDVGHIRATFERLGDITLVDACRDPSPRRRLFYKIIATDGIPRVIKFGDAITFTTTPYVAVDSITLPSGDIATIRQWIGDGERFSFTPEKIGTYTLHLRASDGRTRAMNVDVKECAF